MTSNSEIECNKKTSSFKWKKGIKSFTDNKAPMRSVVTGSLFILLSSFMYGTYSSVVLSISIACKSEQ